MKYTIEEYQGMIDSKYPCVFQCLQCKNGFNIVRVDYSPELCPTCEGNGYVIIPGNTTNNPFVLVDFLRVLKSKEEK